MGSVLPPGRLNIQRVVDAPKRALRNWVTLLSHFRFVASNGLVSDTLTNLVWQQEASATTMTWVAAQSYCSVAGVAFRLPTLKELESLVDVTVTSGSTIPRRRFEHAARKFLDVFSVRWLLRLLVVRQLLLGLVERDVRGGQLPRGALSAEGVSAYAPALAVAHPAAGGGPITRSAPFPHANPTGPQIQGPDSGSSFGPSRVSQ